MPSLNNGQSHWRILFGMQLRLLSTASTCNQTWHMFHLCACACGSVCAVARFWWLWWYLQSLFASVLNRSKNTRITSSVLIVHTPAGNTDLSWNWNSAAFKRRRLPDIEQIEIACECFDNSQRMLRVTAVGNLNSSHTNTRTHHMCLMRWKHVQTYKYTCLASGKREKLDKNRNWEKFRSIGLVYGKVAVGIRWNNKMGSVRFRSIDEIAHFFRECMNLFFWDACECEKTRIAFSIVLLTIRNEFIAAFAVVSMANCCVFTQNYLFCWMKTKKLLLRRRKRITLFANRSSSSISRNYRQLNKMNEN